MSWRRIVRTYALHIGAIFGLMVLAGVVGGYILVKQRLPLPFEDRYQVKLELSTAQSLTPGQGQEVTVAGVKVGEVKDVRLREGRAVVTLDIKRDQLPAVHADARALVRPKTGLNDMTIDVDPGDPKRPALTEDDLLPVDRTAPNVNVDEVLAGLDADVRPYLRGLLQGLGDGLDEGRGIDLRRLLKRLRPTLAPTRELTEAVAARRVELRRLVGNLAKLSTRLSGQSGDLTRLVSQGNATFAALAGEDEALRASLRKLPGTLREADAALSAARPLARELEPTLERLTPVARDLEPALRAVAPLARTGRPAVARLRELSDVAPPVARQLRDALAQLQPATPELKRSVDVLQDVANTLAHNPAGKEEGYLFWLAWFAHNANSMLSTQDANGGLWRGQLIFSCSNLAIGSTLVPALAPAVDAGICPG